MYIYVYLYLYLYLYLHLHTPTAHPCNECPVYPTPFISAVSEAPIPEYGGAPNLCEDLY